jgi:Zn-dependent protease
MLGSEWGHNLAHLSASNLIGKPMDQFRIQLGMPRCVYHQLNDPDVEPREHVVRSLGGPIFNMMVLPLTCLARRLTKPDSIAGATARTAFQTNLFLGLISLLPIPGIDGAPILKWSLVERGKTIPEADEVVRNANGPLALILGLASSLAFLKKKPLAGFFSLMLGGISLSVFTGLLKEEDVTI